MPTTTTDYPRTLALLIEGWIGRLIQFDDPDQRDDYLDHIEKWLRTMIFRELDVLRIMSDLWDLWELYHDES
jgi:hypothetical protein